MNTMKIREVFNPDEMLAIVVSENDPLESVISTFAHNAGLRGIFLVDSRERFTGVITRHDLLIWARHRIGSSSGMGHVSRRDVLRAVFSTTAKDLAHGDWRTLGVKIDDTLDAALNQMIRYTVDFIPVIDEDGKIIGDLRIAQVLLKALEAND